MMTLKYSFALVVGAVMLFVGAAIAQAADAYDVSEATHANSDLNINTIVGGAVLDLAFNDDGTKFFALRSGTIYEFDVATAYDISTATYAGIAEALSVSSEEHQAGGMAFNDDGTKLFVIGWGYDDVVEYDLSTAYDISTASHAGISEEFDVNSEEGTPTDLAFNNDGTKLFVLGTNGDAVVEYNLTTAYDVSTASYAGLSEEFDFSTQEGIAYGLEFNATGSKMFITGSTEMIHEYNLTTAYDVSTASYAGASESLDVSSVIGTLYSITFNNDGSKIFLSGQDATVFDIQIFEYEIPVPSSSSTVRSSGGVRRRFTNAMLMHVLGVQTTPAVISVCTANCLIAQMQTYLISQGHGVGMPIDGIMGSKTQAALESFKIAQNS